MSSAKAEQKEGHLLRQAMMRMIDTNTGHTDKEVSKAAMVSLPVIERFANARIEALVQQGHILFELDLARDDVCSEWDIPVLSVRYNQKAENVFSQKRYFENQLFKQRFSKHSWH